MRIWCQASKQEQCNALHSTANLMNDNRQADDSEERGVFCGEWCAWIRPLTETCGGSSDNGGEGDCNVAQSLGGTICSDWCDGPSYCSNKLAIFRFMDNVGISIISYFAKLRRTKHKQQAVWFLVFQSRRSFEYKTILYTSGMYLCTFLQAKQIANFFRFQVYLSSSL